MAYGVRNATPRALVRAAHLPLACATANEYLDFYAVYVHFVLSISLFPIASRFRIYSLSSFISQNFLLYWFPLVFKEGSEGFLTWLVSLTCFFNVLQVSYKPISGEIFLLLVSFCRTVLFSNWVPLQLKRLYLGVVKNSRSIQWWFFKKSSFFSFDAHHQYQRPSHTETFSTTLSFTIPVRFFLHRTYPEPTDNRTIKVASNIHSIFRVLSFIY